MTAFPRVKFESLKGLLELAFGARRIDDAGFEAAQLQEAQWEVLRSHVLAAGEADVGTWPGPTDDQEHARNAAEGIRSVRNEMAHD